MKQETVKKIIKNRYRNSGGFWINLKNKAQIYVPGTSFCNCYLPYLEVHQLGQDKYRVEYFIDYDDIIAISDDKVNLI